VVFYLTVGLFLEMVRFVIVAILGHRCKPWSCTFEASKLE